MPCIFCVAIFAMLAGAITTAVLDQIEARLASVANGPVSRSVDSESVAKFDLSVPVPTVPSSSGRGAGRPVPVSVTVYKKHRRVRIQVMTHDLTRAEAEAVEDLIAAALGLTIIDRSDAHDEQKVREAFGESDQETAAEKAEAQTVQPEVKDVEEVEPADVRRQSRGGPAT